MVAPSRRWRLTISLRIFTRNSASRLESGSSNRKAFGSLTIARPMATRWLWPPESCEGLRCRRAPIWRMSAARAMRASISAFGSPLADEAEAQVLADAHMRIERIGLEHHRHIAGGGNEMIAADVIEEDLA